MRRKTVILLLLLSFALFLLAEEVRAEEVGFGDYEFGLYQQTLVEDSDLTPRLFLDGYAYFTERVGVWGFAYGEERYVSSVAGLFYDLFAFGEDSVFELGLAAGAETYPEESGSYNLHPRAAGLVFVGNDRLSTSLYYEDWSKSESWLRVEADWQATERFALGFLHQTDDGTGPRVRYSVPDSPVRIWLAPMWGEGERKLLLGLEIVFSN